MKLENRVALVTGGGSGIGRAISLLFAEEGARVVVNDVRLEAAHETVEMVQKDGDAGRAVQADVADSGQVRAMFAEIARTEGALDILVNNAGVASASAEERKGLAEKIEARIREMVSGQGISTHLDVTQAMS